MDQWKILVLGTLRLDLNADFDRIHELANQRALQRRLDRVVLPKKVSAPPPIRPAKAIPSASVCAAVIRRWNRPSTRRSLLEVPGLDRYPDHDLHGFQRYVALAVVARNIQRLGAIRYQQERERKKRTRGPYKKAA